MPMAAKQACMAAELLMTLFLYPYHWTSDVEVATDIRSLQQGNIATNDGAFYAQPEVCTRIATYDAAFYSQPDICAMPVIFIPWDVYGGSMKFTTFEHITGSVQE